MGRRTFTGIAAGGLLLAAVAAVPAAALADDFHDRLAQGYRIVGFSISYTDNLNVFIIEKDADVLVCTADKLTYEHGISYKVTSCQELAQS